MKRVKSLAAVMMGSTLVFCSTTHGGEDTTSRVRAALGQGYEQAPSVSDIEGMGPGADQALIEIFRDPASPMLQRMRALDLLGNYPSEQLKTLLDQESARTDLPPSLKRRLLAVSIRAFGEREPAVAERVWTANSASADATVRYDAAQSLAKIRPSAELMGVARQRAATETDASVRGELDKNLAAAKPR
jgi:hypothetical protein